MTDNRKIMAPRTVRKIDPGKRRRNLPSYMRRAIKGYFYNLDTGSYVRFLINPNALERTEGSNYAKMTSPGATGIDYQYTGGKKREIKFKLLLESLDSSPKDEGVLKEISELELLVFPRGERSLLNSQFHSPPRIAFFFGPRVWEVVVTGLKFKETIFNERLQPLYVEVGVTMEVDLVYSSTNESMMARRRAWSDS